MNKKHGALSLVALGLAMAASGCISAAKAQEQGRLLSAFYGADDAFPQGSDFFVCPGAAGLDGMPVVFSEELAGLPLPEDFRVTGADGEERPVICVTFDPADDPGEQRTVLLAGEFGSQDAQPVLVEVVNDVRSLDWNTTYQGASCEVTPLEAGPTLVLAETLDVFEWDLKRRGTQFPWGGGNSCPAKGLRQVVRVTWDGGVLTPDGLEITQTEWSQYTVTLRGEDGTVRDVTPFSVGDLHDRDNNHELCLSEEGQALKVRLPASVMIDPNGDLNPLTSVVVTD